MPLVYTLPDDGEPAGWREATSGSSSQPFNGFDRILYSLDNGDGTGSVWTVGADQRGPLRMTEQVADKYDYDACWEPVERALLAFTRFTNSTGRYDICVIDTRTGIVTELTTGFNPDGGGGVSAGGFYPSYSPDGETIAFAAYEAAASPDPGLGASIWTMRSDGSNKTKIVAAPDYGTDIANLGADDAVSWSPDGTKIVFQITDALPETENNGLWVVDADGANPTQIVAQDDVGGKIVSVSWSSRDKIAFSANASPYKLFTVDPDGGNLAQLGTIDAYYVSWSPDGTRAVVVTNTNKNVIVDLAGRVGLFLPMTDGYPLNWGQGGLPWGSMSPLVAYVDPSSGTFSDDLIAALIDAGVMEPAP